MWILPTLRFRLADLIRNDTGPDHLYWRLLPLTSAPRLGLKEHACLMSLVAQVYVVTHLPGLIFFVHFTTVELDMSWVWKGLAYVCIFFPFTGLGSHRPSLLARRTRIDGTGICRNGGPLLTTPLLEYSGAVGPKITSTQQLLTPSRRHGRCCQIDRITPPSPYT